jgi:tRNA(fMet)-specific endonuclease VapC
MNRFLLDTGIASDYVNRRAGVFERASESVRRGARLGISSPVLGELWGGVWYSDSPDRNAPRMARHLADFTIWPFDKAAAEEFGRLYATLRRLGRPMQQIDIQTAAIALTLGNCTIVTKDSDFSAVPGLQVADWSRAASP